MKTEIEIIKDANPTLQYDDCGLFTEEDNESFLVPEDIAKQLIEEYYENRTVVMAHWTGNPELEYDVPVSAREYIEYTFGGNYNEALKQI